MILPLPGGWFGALHDPQIGQAILLIHRGPARAWTVASLAGEVAMSTSVMRSHHVAEPHLSRGQTRQ